MYLHALGELALGSRLRALSERFYATVDEAYRACGARIESRWFPVLRYVWEHGPVSVGEVADAIGQTHSAVSQMSDKLVRAGLMRRRRDSRDGRRTRLELTDEGREELGRLGPIWVAIRRGVAQMIERSDSALLDALDRCEAALEVRPLIDDILREYRTLDGCCIVAEPYRDDWRGHFERINTQWLQRHFVVEEVDRRVLADPQGQIIDRGGMVFFATLDGEPIGTCAVLREREDLYELTKMGVEETFRGLGAGRVLLDAAIDWFREHGRGTLFLESSSHLPTALGMYERAGFVRQSQVRPDSHYQRADVYMIYRPGGD